MEIILASKSPRRSELLKQIACKFRIVASEAVEDNEQDIPPELLAVSNARAKAIDVAAKTSDEAVVIGADTIVVLQNRVYGKPSDIDDARHMLIELSGQEHKVITGMAVATGGHVFTDFAVTLVKMRELDERQIETYIQSGEPMDKAGAYAIQGKGALLVESIQGCYYNVVGLPLVTLDILLKKNGVSLL